MAEDRPLAGGKPDSATSRSPFRVSERRAPPVEADMEILRMFEDGDHVFIQARRTPRDGGPPWITMELLQTGAGASAPVGRRFVAAQVIQRANPDLTMVGGERDMRDIEDTALNKARVKAFIEDVLVDRRLDLLWDYVDRGNFVSHNPRVEGGGPGFLRFIRNEMRSATPMRLYSPSILVGQGNFVSAFLELDFRGRRYMACELFRLSGGMLQEHWDLAEPMEDYLGAAPAESGGAG